MIVSAEPRYCSTYDYPAFNAYMLQFQAPHEDQLRVDALIREFMVAVEPKTEPEKAEMTENLCNGAPTEPKLTGKRAFWAYFYGYKDCDKPIFETTRELLETLMEDDGIDKIVLTYRKMYADNVPWDVELYDSDYLDATPVASEAAKSPRKAVLRAAKLYAAQRLAQGASK